MIDFALPTRRTVNWESIVKNERDPHPYSVLGDLTIIDANLMVLYPGALHIVKSLIGALDADANSVLEALGRRRGYFRNLCDTHVSPFRSSGITTDAVIREPVSIYPWSFDLGRWSLSKKLARHAANVIQDVTVLVRVEKTA